MAGRPNPLAGIITIAFVAGIIVSMIGWVFFKILDLSMESIALRAGIESPLFQNIAILVVLVLILILIIGMASTRKGIRGAISK